MKPALRVLAIFRRQLLDVKNKLACSRNYAIFAERLYIEPEPQERGPSQVPGRQITAAGLTAIGGCIRFEELDLGGCPLDDAAGRQLGTLTDLK
jgi:hypothetical protein